MKPLENKIEVLFRPSTDTYEEYEVAGRYFNPRCFRSDCKGPLVIGRYSVLPFYKELEYDLKKVGAKLINSWEQHLFISDFRYYEVIEDLTAKTYFDGSNEWLAAPDGQYVVKGRTNSRKSKWNQLMFAPSKRAAIQIGAELAGDDLLGPQGIIYREFVPLKCLETGINGIPFSNEWRCFFYKQKLLAKGYYWSSASEETCKQAEFLPIMEAAVQEAANRVAQHTNFFVIDVAERQDGGAIVIEINDGQMSGLSEIDPHVLYAELKNALS